jgi:hypothetical protein
MALASVLGAALLIGSCSKKQEIAVNNSSDAAAASASASAKTQAEKDAPYQLKDLQLSVEAYEKIFKRKPASLEQMVKEGFLASLPLAPTGKKFTYDSATGRVSLAP